MGSAIESGWLVPDQSDLNPVVVVYRRPINWSDRMIKIFSGEFTHCEMYLPAESCSFSIFRGETMQCSAVLPNLYRSHPELFAWHMFVLNRHEYRRLMKWNVNQVANRCVYNLSDLAYTLLPSVAQSAFVPDISREAAHSPHKLFCSQAIILALREACSGPDGSPHIEAFINSLNSRTTTPTELANRIVAHIGMDLSSTPVPLTETEAQLIIKKHMVLQQRV